MSAPEVEGCVKAHDEAAVLLHQERWLDAREAMSRCTADVCPIAIRSDCEAWLDDVAAALPTLLVVIERDDDGSRPVRMELGGRSLELPAKIGPIEVLPGPHRLRFVLEGYPPVELHATLAKGEKNHVVNVRFQKPRPAAPVTAPEPPPPPPPVRRRPVPLATYLYGGGALVAFAASGALLGSALVAKASAEDDCAPGCMRGERESIDRRLLLSDIGGILGVGLAGLAVYSYVKRPWVTDRVGGASVRVSVNPGSAELSLGGTF
jgi:hypothetical protein